MTGAPAEKSRSFMLIQNTLGVIVDSKKYTLFFWSATVLQDVYKRQVKFPYNRFNMEIVERQGFDKTIIDSCKVKDDGTYEFKMKVDKPCLLYTSRCV